MPTPRKTPFQSILEKLVAEHPTLIRLQASRNEPVSHEKDAEFNVWVRYTGNILLARPKLARGQEPDRKVLLDNFRTVRGYLAEMGHEPKLDSQLLAKGDNGAANIDAEVLMYEIPVGTCEVRLLSGKRKTLLRSQAMIDRIYVGYVPWTWDCREKY
ncbi:hypothetical protein HY642_01390 [Candidatus Woesearchaeota archaeon]|nr:hypothetical protein [Candidatus Woesearchaeota archaeon]